MPPHVFLPLRVLIQCVLYDDILLLDGGQAVVEAVVLHLLVMIASVRERHASSLVTTGGFFIIMLLVVVEVFEVPLLARNLLPGAFRLVRRWLFPTSMLRLVPSGRSRLVLACIAGVGWSFRY